MIWTHGFQWLFPGHPLPTTSFWNDHPMRMKTQRFHQAQKWFTNHHIESPINLRIPFEHFWVMKFNPVFAGNKSISALEIPNGFFISTTPRKIAFSAVFAKLKIFTSVLFPVDMWYDYSCFKVPPNLKQNTADFRHLQKFPTQKSAVRRVPKRELIQELCTKKGGLPSKNWRTHDNDFVLFEKFLFRIRDLGKTSEKVKMQSPAHHPESPMGRRFF